MDKFEIFLMIYVLLSYKDIAKLPGKAGAVFYKAIAAVMLALTGVHIAWLAGCFPWVLYDSVETAQYNLGLNLGLLLLAYISIGYMNRKPVEKDPAITPSSLRNFLEMYRLRQIKNSLWFMMIALFIFTKILTDYSLSTSWCVFLGTVAVFMIVYVLYKMQKWLINNASPFEDVPKKILNEWLSREYYTEEEQGLLRARLVKMGLLRAKVEVEATA